MNCSSCKYVNPIGVSRCMVCGKSLGLGKPQGTKAPSGLPSNVIPPLFSSGASPDSQPGWSKQSGPLPPSVPRPDSAPLENKAPRSSGLVGRISGGVELRTEERSRGSGTILAVALIILAVLLLWKHFLSFLFSLIPLFILLMLPALFFPGLRSFYGKLFSVIFRGAGSVASGAMRASVNSGRGRPAARTVEIRSFRVIDDHGDEHHCTMVGNLSGADLRNGDAVRIRGRRTLSSGWRVRSVQQLGSGAVLRASLSPAAQGSRMLWGLTLGAILLDVILIFKEFR
ncbi:MAG: hypothetical protein WCO31_07055 [Actinomycetes bacterium]